MKIQFLIILSLSLVNSTLAQIRFENGYFIDTSGQKTECLIKNIDWKNNPVMFHYKMSEEDEARTADIKTVKEFGINGFSKYVRADVKIDRSASVMEDLTTNSQPEFSQEQLFLKVLVEGPAILYVYTEKNFGRFFYKTASQPIEQLIFKEFYDANDQVKSNNTFRKQLASNVHCAGSANKSTTYLTYSQSEFIKYFRLYNECKGGITSDKTTKKKVDFLNLKIASGFDYSSLKYFSLYTRDYDFGRKLNFRISLEAEFIMPFNKSKWRILLAPTFQYFNSTATYNSNVYYNSTSYFPVIETATIKYKSIEFPLGVRHYFFLNDNAKLFLNAIYVSNFSIDFNSVMTIRKTEVLSFNSMDSFAFGAGMEYKKLSAEFRYYTNRDLLNGYVTRRTAYNRLSFIIGYTLF